MDSSFKRNSDRKVPTCHSCEESETGTPLRTDIPAAANITEFTLFVTPITPNKAGIAMH